MDISLQKKLLTVAGLLILNIATASLNKLTFKQAIVLSKSFPLWPTKYEAVLERPAKL